MKSVLVKGDSIRIDIQFTDLLKRSELRPRLVIIANSSEKRCNITISQREQESSTSVAPGESEELFTVESGPVKIIVASCQERLEESIELDRPRIIDFNLLMFSHVDLGYTAPIKEVERLQAHYTAKAIQFYNDSLPLPEESRFRWNIETTWAFSCFEKRYGQADYETARDLLKRGEFGIGALFLHHYADRTEFEELFHSLERTRSLRASGMKIKSAFLSDVPGVSTGLLELLFDTGVENLFMSINNFVAPFKEYTNLKSPFWWRLPSGAKILAWFTDDPKWAYIEGHRFFGSDIETLKGEVIDKLASLDVREYEFPVYAIPMAIDNREPIFTPVELIKDWNASWRNPHISTATIDSFFDRLRPWCSLIQEVEGEFNGWWTSNILAYPRENSLSSHTFSILHEASILNGLSNGENHKEIEEAFELIGGFDEHSGGGGLYLSKDPEAILDAVTQGFGWVFRANRLACETINSLRERVFGSGNYITAFNPTGLTRNDFCVMNCDDPELSLEAPDGTEVSSLFYSGKLFFDPGELKGFEHRRFLPRKKAGRNSVSESSTGNLEVSTDHFDLSFNDRGELESIVAKENGRELLSSSLTAGKLKIVRTAVNPTENLADAIEHDELYTGKASPNREEDYLPVKCGFRVFESRWGKVIEFQPIDRFCRPFRKSFILPAESAEIILSVRIHYIYDVGPSDFLFLEVPLNVERPEISYSTPGRIAPQGDLISGSGTDTLTVLGGLRIDDTGSGFSVNIGLEGINLVDFASPSPLRFRRDLPASGRLFFRLFNGNLQNRFASPFLNGEPMDFAVRLSTGSTGLPKYSVTMRNPISVFKSGRKAAPILAGLKASDNVELFLAQDRSMKPVLLAKEVAGEKGYLIAGDGRRYDLKAHEFLRTDVQVG